MTARERILRDNGLLILAGAIALGSSTGAAAATKPSPHNFPRPPHVLTYHPDPHNFAARRQAT
jgi:Tfp pilus assembly ATPase PilU